MMRDVSFTVLFSGAQIESDQHPVLVGQIADDLAHRLRKLSHQRGQSDNLIAARQRRILQQIDYFDGVFRMNVRFADLLEVADRCARALGLSRHIKTQIPSFRSAWHSLQSSTCRCSVTHGRFPLPVDAVRPLTVDAARVSRSPVARAPEYALRSPIPFSPSVISRTSCECAMPRLFRT